tara:strand:+ start:345 stop:1310 length:966 start_codon:yes stop_codon:yes gene_type:complete
MKLSAFYILLFAFLYSCVGTDEITIDKPEVSIDEKIVIGEGAKAVLVGGQSAFTATYTNTKGEKEAVSFEWNSITPAIATIDLEGVATGLSEGGTIITAKFGEIVSNQVTLNVVKNTIDLATILIKGTTTMLYLSETTMLTTQSFDLEGNEITGSDYTWVSTDESLATINNEGEITASSSNTGVASIYAMADGKMSNIYTIEILDEENILVRKGVFQGYSGYLVSGDITLEQEPGGSFILKFGDNFISAQGPGLVVYLSNSDVEVIKQGIEIQPLGQLSGAFEINISEIAPNVMLTDYQYVIIHCKPFNVRFGGAQLGSVE